MNTKDIDFESINPFKMNISYLDENIPQIKSTQHIHSECEIYFNISGDVSFMVENNIYPISHGSIIITRPYEYHHCIYHTHAVHRHYWILFSCDGNENLFDLFFKRNLGEKNLIVLNPADTDRMDFIMKKLISGECTSLEKFSHFFEIINKLNYGTQKNTGDLALSFEISEILNKINTEFSQPISVSELSKSIHMSINTLERHFKNQLGITPREYIFQRRISNPISLLANGSSVIDACNKSGFSDYSHFISLFKNRFGITPLQYKKIETNQFNT